MPREKPHTGDQVLDTVFQSTNSILNTSYCLGETVVSVTCLVCFSSMRVLWTYLYKEAYWGVGVTLGTRSRGLPKQKATRHDVFSRKTVCEKISYYRRKIDSTPLNVTSRLDCQGFCYPT